MKLFNYLSFENRKLEKAVKAGYMVGSFNLTPKVTCPFADQCKKYCYACKGNFCYPAAIEKRRRSTELTKTDEFFPIMNAELRIASAIAKSKDMQAVMRLHDSGDFYARDYVLKVFAVMRANPEMKFYAYTKSWVLFDGLSVPDNFHFYKSVGGLNDHLIDFDDQHCIIIGKNEAVPEGYIFGSVDGDIPAIEGVQRIALRIH